MKAKNPYGEDFIEVNFPEGPGVKLWQKVCRACGGVAGGCFSGPGLPEPFISPYAVCPGCGGKDLALEEVVDRD